MPFDIQGAMEWLEEAEDELDELRKLRDRINLVLNEEDETGCTKVHIDDKPDIPTAYGSGTSYTGSSLEPTFKSGTITEYDIKTDTYMTRDVSTPGELAREEFERQLKKLASR